MHKASPDIFRDTAYIYRLTSHPAYNFITGTDAEGRQAIIGALGERLVCFIFSPDGDLCQRITESLPSRIDKQLLQDFPGEDYPDVQALLRKLGVVESQIRIHRFLDPETGVGIKDLPGFCAEFLQNPSSYLNGIEQTQRQIESQETKDMIGKWKNDGTYVFWWDNDYYVDASGEIVSS